MRFRGLFILYLPLHLLLTLKAGPQFLVSNSSFAELQEQVFLLCQDFYVFFMYICIALLVLNMPVSIMKIFIKNLHKLDVVQATIQ